MTEQENPWQEAKDKFDNVIIPKLTKLGFVNNKEGNFGSKFASDILKLYNSVCCSFDPVVVIILEEAINEYEKHSKNLE